MASSTLIYEGRNNSNLNTSYWGGPNRGVVEGPLMCKQMLLQVINDPVLLRI